jgi:tetratricopeptide (TPR) repeat protein
MRLAFYLCLLIFPVSTAKAEWLQSSTSHFVVYGDDTEPNIRRFSEQLERYHSAMSKVTGVHPETPSPSNRLTVYIVSGEHEVRKLHGGDNRYIGGFYIPRAGGSIAIVPRVKAAGSGELAESMLTLLHEYAHHFLISNSNFPMPRWLSEGGAEFFASAQFERDGGISLGRPALHRAGELFYINDVKAADLFDPEDFEKRKNRGYDSFYGKSWLLYHYLSLGGTRGTQLPIYLRAIAEGKNAHEAALLAFGNFDALERELNGYMKKNRMAMIQLPASMLKIGPVTVRRLNAGETAMMPVRIRSERGVTKETAAALLDEARAIAGRNSGDPAVLATLAEAEFDAGNDKEAIAAADAALAVDRTQVNAYVQKGYALFNLAKEADNRAAAFAEALKPFIALNELENDHPLPLIYYFHSFALQGKEPPSLALEGLERAAQLAPFDLDLRMMLARQQIKKMRIEAARRNLSPIAYNPHGGDLATVARKMLARLEIDPSWDGQKDIETILGAATAKETASGD